MDDNNLYGKAYGLNERGRHANIRSAVAAALKDLLTEHNAFFDSLADQWERLFPELKAKPGRYENGYIIVYCKNAALAFSVRPKLRMVAKRLAELPGAPKNLKLKLEIHSHL